MGKFVSKNQNFVFEARFDTYTNSNMQNSMGIITFSVFCFKYEISFFGIFSPKIYNCQLKLKFDTKTNLIMQKVMVDFILFVLD